MGLRIGDTAPDFEADSTEGRLRFHDWIGSSWAVLFSHPKDFTPVCTTELGYMAKIKPEFDRRNVKIMGLSADSAGDHARWAARHRGDAGPRAELPGDRGRRLQRFEAVRHAARGHLGRPSKAHSRGQPDSPQRLRDRPGQEDQAHPRLPDDNRAQLRRSAARHRLSAADREAQGSTPVNWRQGEDVIIAGSVSDDEARKAYPQGWKAPRPYIRIVPQPREPVGS